MRAVIQTGGKQYIVATGQELDIEKIDTGDKKTLELDALLIIDEKDVKVGTPLVDGIKVKADIVGDTKGEKLRILKFKSKKRMHKLTGHRQHYTRIKITAIGKEVEAKKSTSAKKTPAKKTSKTKTAAK